MPEHVRQRLLDDPEHGEIHLGRQDLGAFTGSHQIHRKAGAPDLCEHAVQARETGQRHMPGVVGLVGAPGTVNDHAGVVGGAGPLGPGVDAEAGESEGRAQLLQRVVAGAPDRLKRGPGLFRTPVEDMEGDPGLQGDDRQPMTHDVVYLAIQP